MRPVRLQLCLLLAACASPLLPASLAQTPAPTPAPAAPDYAAESLVIQHADALYVFTPDGTGYRERTLAIRVQSEAAVRALGVIAIPYAGNSEQVEILYARVRRPDGTVIDTDTSGSLDMPEPVTREAPFYSDLKEKQLPVRSLKVGDTLEWKARITRTKAEAPGNFWGQESFTDAAVSLDEAVELRVPAGVYVNVWSPTRKPVETTTPATSTTPAQHIYRWTSSQLKPTAGKEAEAAAEAKKKIVWTAAEELDAEQGKLPAVAWTTFHSWEDVGLWYRSLETDRIASSPEIKAKVAELIAGKSSPEEKVRALYSYVATQIRYIGVDFGIGRYQPHTAAEILSNQYGDCKDKHTLLAAMLSAAGIPSDAVLIGAGIRFNPDLPAPSAFNHLITHLTLASAAGPSQSVWLDTTAEIAPYRLLYAVIRDKPALIVPLTGAPRIDRTPASPPFPNVQTWDSTGSLDKDGTSHSRITLTFRGDDELGIRNAFRQVAPAQYDQVVQQFLHNLGYAGTTSNAEVSRPEDTTDPVKISFDYEREKAGDWPNLKTIPQLAPVALPRYDDKDPLVRTLDLGTPRVESSHAAMKLPEGWGTILPEAVHFKTAYATYDQTYRFEKGTVYSERRIEVLQQKVPVADLKTYKKWADDADIGNELYIQLIKHDPGKTIDLKIVGGKGEASPVIPPASTLPTPQIAKSTPKEDAPADTSPVTDPGKLMQQALTLMQQHDVAAAEKDLDTVKASHPEEQGLWAMYGILATEKRAPLDAIADYQKELKLHPENSRVYMPLVATQLQLAQRREAMDSLRAWIAADSSDPQPAAQLINLLSEDGDYAAAVKIGDAALPNIPDDPKVRDPFVLTLASAQIKGGEKEKGQASLEALLKNNDSPFLLNDAAYALADAGLDLPLDHTATRSALDKLSDESNTWTLDEDPGTLRARNTFITATWDTMGWILFREGKLAEAQGYLDAAWAGTQDTDTGEHLGEVALARGNKSAAMAAFELALAKSASYDSLGVRRPPGPKEKELQAHIDALAKAGVKSTIGTPIDPYKQLQTIRTLPLGPAEGRSGDAEYRLLIKNGKVTKVEPAGDKQVDRADAILAKAKFNGYFPPDSQMAIARTGFLNCHAATCELVLQPLR